VILERAESDPGGLALDDGTRTRTWAELEERVRRIAHWLRDDLGLGPEEHAALLLGNRVEGVELMLGALCSGVWCTPINHHGMAEDVDHVVRDSGARVVVCDDDHAARAEATGVFSIRVGGELEAALQASSPAPLAPDDPAGANMIYTSGTTGRPKGVKRARAASLGEALAAWRRYGHDMGLDGSGPHLVTGPLYHAAPLMFAVYDLLNGAPVIVMPRFDAARALELLAEREVAHTHFVPTMFVRLLGLPQEQRDAFSTPRLDLVLHGAAPIAPSVKRRMIDWWGPLLVEYWGGTEGGVSTLVDSKAWLAHPGTVGQAVRGFEVFAADDEGRRLPSGEVGTLYSRHESGRQVFAYHGDPRKTEAAHLPGGAFTLGDVGCVDAQGWVFLADRRSHTIISGGVNIYPAEIEQVLIEHVAVADVGVFGIPDDEWGESVKAAVELCPGFSPSPELEQEILGFARTRLAGYKVPRSVDFEAELPRNPIGKLLVRQLRDPYWAGRRLKI
jgi:acyl-CoA synthetase (AMP-forming)/AMP-acid ligase II